MIETIVKNSRSLSRPQLVKFVYAVCVLLFAGLYAHRYFRNGFYLPEEPYILDFSSLLRIPRDGTDVGMPLGTNGQISIAFPWSGISYLWYKIGGSTYGHVQLVLFIRAFVIVFLIQKLYRHFMTDSFALIFAALVFTTSPIRVAVLYTHWFSHIVLVLGVLLFFLDEQQRSTTQYVIRSVLITGLTVSVFSNPPHLVTAWLASPIGLFLIYRLKVEVWHEALKKLKALIVVGVLVYIIPGYFYLQNLSVLRKSKPAEMFSSSGETVINGLMGFGSWWNFASYQGSESTAYFYELTNFSLTSPIRYLLKSLLIALVVVYSLFQLDKSNGRVLRDRKDENNFFFTLMFVVLIFNYLSLLGQFHWFWYARELFPLVLGMFREPYPKFAPTAQIFLHAVFGVVIAKACSKHFTKVLVVLVAVIVVFMVIPVFNSQLGVSISQPTSQDPDYSWSSDSLRSLDYAAQSLENYQEDFCLYDLGSSRLVSVFLELKHPRLFTDLRGLVPTSELEAYASTGRFLEPRGYCFQRNEMALVLKSSNEGYSEWDVRTSTECVVDSNDFFIILRNACIGNATSRIGSDRINQTIFMSGTESSYPVFKSTHEPSWIASTDPFWLVMTTKFPSFGTITIEYTDTPLESFGSARKNIELAISGNTAFNIRDYLPCFDYNGDCWTGIFSVEVGLSSQRIDHSL